MGTNTKLITKVVLEILTLILLGAGCLYLHKAGPEPYQRGFYCDDENIKKPFKEDTVSEVVCFVIWAFLAAAILISVEMVSFISHPSVKNDDDVKIPSMVIEFYRVIGSFCIGAVFCMLATEMSKMTIGELRPHFLTICNPQLSKTMCYGTEDTANLPRYGMVFVEDILYLELYLWRYCL